MKWIKENKIKSALLVILTLFLVWFLTREVQAELPYKLSGSEILAVKEQCKQLAEGKESEWKEVFNVELIGSGYSERGGFCYMEYFHDFDDWTSKTLYNTTEEKEILARKWPGDEILYQRGFNWFIKGKKRFYQTTF